MNSEKSPVISTTPFELTARERRQITLLLVETDQLIRISLRQALVSLGYGQIYDCPDPYTALEKMENHHFTHVIFEAKHPKMPAREFLGKLLEHNRNITALPSCHEPTVDDVINLLISGAKGYLVKPFTAGSLEESIGWATKGDPITDSIRHTKGRNEALAAVVLSALDRLAVLLRQSRQFHTAKYEIPKRRAYFRRAAQTARTFAKGGERELRNTIIAMAIARSKSGFSRAPSVKKRTPTPQTRNSSED